MIDETVCVTSYQIFFCSATEFVLITLLQFISRLCIASGLLFYHQNKTQCIHE